MLTKRLEKIIWRFLNNGYAIEEIRDHKIMKYYLDNSVKDLEIKKELANFIEKNKSRLIKYDFVWGYQWVKK